VARGGRTRLWSERAVVLASLSGLLASLDTSVNIAFPAITQAFGLNLMSIQWVVVSYVLTYASLLLGCGRLADLWGHGQVLIVGLMTSALAFVACGLAPTLPWLLAGRVLQGLGVALVFASAPALVTLAVPIEERGRALGAYQMSAAIGFAVGPLFGGLLVDGFGWRGVFLFRVLPALLIAAFALNQRHWKKPSNSREHFDLFGAVLLATCIAALLLAVSRSRDSGWLAIEVLLLSLASIGGLAVFLFHERRVAAPVLNLGLFRWPAFTIANLLTLVANCTRFPIGLLVPYYAITVLHYPATMGGFLLIPAAVMTTLAAAFAGAWSDRVGTAGLSSAGLFVQCVGLYMASHLDGDSGYFSVALALGLVGLGLGTFQVPNMSFIMGAIPRTQQGVAGSINQMMRTFGIVFGVTGASLLFERQRDFYADLGAREAFVRAFQGVFLVAAGICAVAVALSLFRQRSVTEHPAARTC